MLIWGTDVPTAPTSRWSPPAISRSAISSSRTTTSVWSRSRPLRRRLRYWALKTYPLRPPAHRRDLRSRNRGRVRHQRHPGLHGHLRASERCWARSAAPSMAPKISVTLGIGVEVIVLAFAVVAIGGMGSIEGALIGALIVGIVPRRAPFISIPQLELFVIYAVMALVLVFRPHGLFTAGRNRGRSDMTGLRMTCGRARTWSERSPSSPWRAAAPALPAWLVSLATIAFANALVVVLGLVILWRAGLVPVRAGAVLSRPAPMRWRCSGATPAGATRSCWWRSRAVAGRHGGVPGRIPARALSRYLLRDAQPRDVDDPLRRAGEDRDARLDRRLPRRRRRPSSAMQPRGRRAQPRACSGWRSACRRSAAFLVTLYFRSVAGALAVPVRDNEIRLEFLGISVTRLIHLKLVISGILAGIGGALAALCGRPCRSQHGLLDDLGRLRIRDHPRRRGARSRPRSVGSLVFELVRSIAVDLLPGVWQLILGSALLLTILFLPEGLGSLFYAPAPHAEKGS